MRVFVLVKVLTLHITNAYRLLTTLILIPVPDIIHNLNPNPLTNPRLSSVARVLINCGWQLTMCLLTLIKTEPDNTRTQTHVKQYYNKLIIIIISLFRTI